MKHLACILFSMAVSAAQPSSAQTYQYNDRVSAQNTKSESFLKPSTYNDRVTGQNSNTGSFLKRNNYNDRVGRSTNIAPQNFKQQSFLPRPAPTNANKKNASQLTKRTTTMPLKPKKDNKTAGSIKNIPKLKQQDFVAPKTDGGNTPFNRYEVAVPEAPKLKNAAPKTPETKKK